MLGTAECVEYSEYRVALDLARVFDAQVVGIVYMPMTFFFTSSAVSER